MNDSGNFPNPTKGNAHILILTEHSQHSTQIDLLYTTDNILLLVFPFEFQLDISGCSSETNEGFIKINVKTNPHHKRIFNNLYGVSIIYIESAIQCLAQYLGLSDYSVVQLNDLGFAPVFLTAPGCCKLAAETQRKSLPV